MKAGADRRRELSELLARLREGELDGAGMARLEALVAGDASARDFYLDYLDLCASLRWAVADQSDAKQDAAGPDPSAASSPVAIAFGPSLGATQPGAGHLSFSGLRLGLVPAACVFTAVVVFFVAAFFAGFFGHAVRGPAPTVAKAGPSLSRGAGSGRQETAGKIAPIARPRGGLDAPPAVVATIVRMVDCRWADPKKVVRVGDGVALGDKYSLASGLLEVAYSGGPSVILRGPAAYEVDSAGSGFLRVGTLTLNMDRHPVGATANRPFFCLHVPAPGGAKCRRTIRTRDVNLTATVARSGNSRVDVPDGVLVSGTLDSVKPLQMVGLPDVPSTVFGSYAEGDLCLTLAIKGPRSLLAGKKRQREQPAGLARESKETKQGQGERPANRPKT
jgi:hypothetical protein